MTGKMGAAKEGIAKLLKVNRECWAPLLVALIGGGMLSIGALEYIEGRLSSELALESVGAVLGDVVTFTAFSAYITAVRRKLNWEKLKHCMLAIGIDLPIVIMFTFVLYRISYDREAVRKRINEKSPFTGETLLQEAVRANDLLRVKRLIKRGAQVNIKGADGNTPLHNAAIRHNEAIIDVLLKATGAEKAKNMRNDNGLTPSNYLNNENMPELQKKLQPSLEWVKSLLQ